MGVADEFPAGVVQVVVMGGAEQSHLVQIGGAVVEDHFFEVVGFAPSGWPVASWPSASAVAGDHRVVLRIRRKAGGGAVVEDR